MFKIFAPVLMALVLLFTQTTGVSAWTLFQDRWFSTGTIDSNSNSKFDLTVCWGTSNTQKLYTNRAVLMTALRETWGLVIVGDNDATHISGFASNGLCGSANIVITYANLGSCNLIQSTIGRT